VTKPSGPVPSIPDSVRSSGRSMRPLIVDGSRIDLRPASCASVLPGDIIVFRLDGRLVAHRLIGTRRDGESILLRQKGDTTIP